MKIHDSATQAYLDEMSTDLAKRIDNEIMQDLLGAAGWTRIKLESNHDKDEVAAWAKANCDRHHGYAQEWAFASPSDATWFAIRWS
jgi:hypothetical protein